MSQLEIFPKKVDVYPNDQRLFELRALYPPPMWKVRPSPLAGIVLPDFSLRRTSANLNINLLGEGAFQLVRGLGTIEWTLDAQSVPISDGQFSMNAFLTRPGVGFWNYEVRILAGSIQVRQDGVLNTTLAITPVVGMRFKIEIVSGFRLYINDVLQHSWTSLSSSVAYPAIYLGSMSGTSIPVQTQPARIPAPKLIGEWVLAPLDSLGNPNATFSVDHGSLSNGANALQKIYSGGTVPGSYILRGDIDPGFSIWMFDSIPSGATQITSGGDAWTFVTSNPAPFSGGNSHKSSNISGDHSHGYQNATDTVQINQGDILYCYVFPDTTNPTTEIMLEWQATDATGFAHRAYWGANSLTQGTDGTASRRFMGALPTAGQWTRLTVPADLVDMVGRVAAGLNFRIFNGQCSFDQNGRIPTVQHAEAIIVIPALQILGDLARTLQPGAKTRFQTNYDVAQTSIVTWSVVSGGGSFSQGEYTAASTPGTSVVRASSTGNQVADITINVPAVITPSFTFAGPSEQIDWDTNIVSPTWSSSPSGINSSTGVWTAPSGTGQTVKITATDGTFTVTRDVIIIKKFPITRFATPMQWRRSKNVLVSEAEDGTFAARIKNKDGKPREAYEARITLVSETDLQTIEAFWDEHHPSKRFIFENVPRNIRKIVRFDSDLAIQGGTQRWEVSFRVKEVE